MKNVGLMMEKDLWAGGRGGRTDLLPGFTEDLMHCLMSNDKSVLGYIFL